MNEMNVPELVLANIFCVVFIHLQRRRMKISEAFVRIFLMRHLKSTSFVATLF